MKVTHILYRKNMEVTITIEVDDFPPPYFKCGMFKGLNIPTTYMIHQNYVKWVAKGWKNEMGDAARAFLGYPLDEPDAPAEYWDDPRGGYIPYEVYIPQEGYNPFKEYYRGN